MAATTGRAALPDAGAEKPSLEPVLTFRALPASRARDRCTAGIGPAAEEAGPDVRPFLRSGVILRTRTGATGAAGAGVLTGELGRVVSAARWTTAGCGADASDRAATGGVRTGIAEGSFGSFDIGLAGTEGGGAPGSPVGVAPCRGPAVPG
ncbi:hypothetical protein OG520_02900 [Streptomyces sp. NBC_00984]|uniref:hypothetical protein n=1 Tax=Streptomyces sp. NBC_00984 TaxID=2903700 RepID=UPI003870DDE5|nr:hypothetical protein OG520_02900 [Streptomyces sp. NBC_00984]